MGPLFCPKQRFNGAEIFTPGRAWAVKPTIKILVRRVNTLVVWGKIKRNYFAGICVYSVEAVIIPEPEPCETNTQISC